jgi:hypothetical protein
MTSAKTKKTPARDAPMTRAARNRRVPVDDAAVAHHESGHAVLAYDVKSQWAWGWWRARKKDPSLQKYNVVISIGHDDDDEDRVVQVDMTKDGILVKGDLPTKPAPRHKTAAKPKTGKNTRKK